MELDPRQVKQLKQRLKRQRPPVSRSEERPSRRIEGEMDGGCGDALGYGSVIVYVERGLGGSGGVIGQVVQAAFDVQRDYHLRYWLCLFSFGWDDETLHHVGRAHQGSVNTPARPSVKELCELSGTEFGPQPAAVPCLFPIADPYGQKRDVRREDLLVFICSGRSVQMAETAMFHYHGLVARNAVWVFVGGDKPEIEFGYTLAPLGATKPTLESEQMAATDSLQQRGLSPDFMRDLTTDGALLEPIWRLVRADSTLSLCIRNGYINLYYRGGNLVCIEQAGPGRYTFDADPGYGKGYGQRSAHLPQPEYQALKLARTVADPQGVSFWLQQVPLLKFAMDVFLAGKHVPVAGLPEAAAGDGGTEHLEREYQQLVERANNSNRSTDYFILDLEYTTPGCTELRLDMVALRWPANKRRQAGNRTLAVIEMKYGQSAVSGKCGICRHVEALRDALNRGALQVGALAQEMAAVTAQRVELNLIDWPGKAKADGKQAYFDSARDQVLSAGDRELEYIILLADYPRNSPRLWEELQLVQAMGSLPFSVRIATANCMGYGLYESCIYPLDRFMGQLPFRSEPPRKGKQTAPGDGPRETAPEEPVQG